MSHRTELLFDEDPLTKTKTIFVMEDGSDEFQLITQQEIDPLLAANQAERKEKDARTPYGDMDRVASIPLNIWWELKREGIADDEKALRKWLNDPENKVFRTREGRV